MNANMNANMPHIASGGQYSGNSMIDMFRTQIMTMTMFSSINGNKNDESSGKGSTTTDGLYGLLYIFLITQFIEFICKNAPVWIAFIVNYYKNKVKTSKLANSLSNTINNKIQTKSSSIIVKLSVNDAENVIGQALMDFITNNNNTKHVSFNNTHFILNQDDIIEISDEIFIQLIETSTKSEDDAKKTNDIIQTINLFSYTLSMQQLRLFLDKIAREFKLKIQNKLGGDNYYFNQISIQAIKQSDGTKDYSKLPNNCVFSMKKFHTNRKFENLFGPEINVIRTRVEFFIKNKKWYDKKGIPYTLGLLLSGQAGAGKTSTIKCLANETHRHIININLNNDITKNQLESLFFNEVITTINVATSKTEQFCIPLEQRIYVLEDIDCQSDMVIERTLNKPQSTVDNSTKRIDGQSIDNHIKNDDYQKIDLSFLLNLLDGILETPGRIIILTSNHPKLLDHALVRPGRIDVIADFKKCDNKTIIEMIEYFYDITLNNEEYETITKLTEYIISPAEMGKIMFENFSDYKYAIKKAIDVNVNNSKNDTNVIMSDNVSDNVGGIVGDNVGGIVGDNVGGIVGDNVGGIVRDNVGDNVGGIVRDNVGGIVSDNINDVNNKDMNPLSNQFNFEGTTNTNFCEINDIQMQKPDISQVQDCPKPFSWNNTDNELNFSKF